MCVCVHAQSCPTLWSHGLWSAKLFYPWNFPGKNTGAGCHFLLQVIFLTQELNLGLVSPALAGGFFTPAATWEAHLCIYIYIYTCLMKLGEQSRHTFLCLNVRVRVIYLILKNPWCSLLKAVPAAGAIVFSLQISSSWVRARVVRNLNKSSDSSQDSPHLC